ncbi:MAG: methyltransferase [Alphaproteobacteria bacterium]|nr:methyltransferase [Alphaproteobacteria bacterium]
MQAPADFIRAQTQVLSPAIVPELRLHLATEVMPLWQKTEEALREDGVQPPFWAFAWPGGQGVARYILDNPEIVAGRRVLDLASGSGLIAIAAMKAGAKSAMAVDIDRLALEACGLNAGLNAVSIRTCEQIDFARPYRNADAIFAGDICYQQAMSTTLLRWLRICVEADIPVLIGDPGRAYVPERGLQKLASYEVPTSRDLEDKDVRTATVWRLEKITQDEEG